MRRRRPFCRLLLLPPPLLPPPLPLLRSHQPLESPPLMQRSVQSFSKQICSRGHCVQGNHVLMAPKQNRIAECLLGDRRWAVPCSATYAASTRVFLLRLPEPCIVTDVVLDTRLPCSIADVDVCCPQLDESQGA